MSKLNIECIQQLLTSSDLDLLARAIVHRSTNWYIVYIRDECDQMRTIEAKRFKLYCAMDEEHLYEQVLLDSDRLFIENVVIRADIQGRSQIPELSWNLTETSDEYPNADCDRAIDECYKLMIHDKSFYTKMKDSAFNRDQYNETVMFKRISDGYSNKVEMGV